MDVTFQEERVAFHWELGLTLAQWAQVEGALLELVTLCFAPAERPHLGLGFVQLDAFRAKRAFADGVLERRLRGTILAPEWAKLADRMGDQSQTRNALVHQTVVEFPASKPGKRIASCPWEYPKGWDKLAPHGDCTCFMAVVKARLEFAALTRSLERFFDRCSGQQERHSQSAQQAENPPMFSKRVRQIYAELGRPLQSSREKRLAESAANAAYSLAESNSKGARHC